jgi:hypothetical protein
MVLFVLRDLAVWLILIAAEIVHGITRAVSPVAPPGRLPPQASSPTV